MRSIYRCNRFKKTKLFGVIPIEVGSGRTFQFNSTSLTYDFHLGVIFKIECDTSIEIAEIHVLKKGLLNLFTGQIDGEDFKIVIERTFLKGSSATLYVESKKIEVPIKAVPGQSGEIGGIFNYRIGSDRLNDAYVEVECNSEYSNLAMVLASLVCSHVYYERSSG